MVKERQVIQSLHKYGVSRWDQLLEAMIMYIVINNSQYVA